MTENVLDTSGLNCPLPVLKTKKALLDLQPGELLEVFSTDPGSVADMAAFCRMGGYELLESTQPDHRYRFLIRR